MDVNNQSTTSNFEAAQAVIQLVIFNLGSEEYAVPISDVKEVVKTPEITPVPNSPSFVLGIINLRGNIVPILDLQKVFGLNIEEKDIQKKHVLVTETGSSYGILVNKVTEVISVRENEIQDAPEITSASISKDFVQGVVIVEDDDEFQNESADVNDNNEVESDQRALLILRVSKIITAEDVKIDPSVLETPVAQVDQNDVQNIEEVNKEKVNDEQYQSF
jgi:purine-binding chemotaxis protein CheW